MISIIIDNYNRSYLLPLIMKAYTWLATQVPAEMIIVDDESDPQDHFHDYVRLGLDTVKPWYRVRAFRAYETKRNVGATLNIGVKQSVGNVLILNHSDVMPVTPGVLEKVLERHKAIPNLYLTPKMVCSHPDFPTRGMSLPLGASVSRELFFRIGGFDERFTGYGPEDVDFSYRIIHGITDLGCRWIEDPAIVYIHLEQAKLPIRDNYKNKEENERILLENERNKVRIVNPSGWGFCPKLEEIKLE